MSPQPAVQADPRGFTPQERAELRAEAWLDIPRPLLVPPFDRSGRAPRRAFKLAPYTAQRENLLHGYASPLVTGQPFVDRLHLLLTLYLVSPSMRAGSRLSFLCFVLRWWHLPFGRTVVALQRWHTAQFLDRPPREVGSLSAPPPGAYAFAGFILTCKHRLKLTEREAMTMPIPRLLQQLTALEGSRGGDTPAFDPERDRRVGDYLRAKQAAREAAARN
jgi:hypothetical protein